MNIQGIGSNATRDYIPTNTESTTKEEQLEALKIKLTKKEDTAASDKAAEAKEKQAKKAKQKEQEDLNKKITDTYNQLSDRAKEYLSKLKERFGNMDITIADVDSDEEAAKIMSQGTKSFSVLMDSKTLEEMAANETVAAEYENLIADSANELTALKDSANDQGVAVKAVGMKLNDDGTKTYYSIIEDSLSYYDKELKKQEEKKEAKLEKKKEAEEKEKQKEERKEALEQADQKQEELVKKQLSGQYALLTAGTIDELKARLHLETEKVDKLKRSQIFAGVGIDYQI